jgi:pimeloyl-ACP methyl ester carboxylesterase
MTTQTPRHPHRRDRVAGMGPVALFVHGVLMNKHLWRHQLAALGDIRRCIAADLLAHGDTEIAPDQDVSVTAKNAHMLRELLDALAIDLVGNDSGGGICQIFAALNPERARTLTLTNCDTHDNWSSRGVQGLRRHGPRRRPQDTLTAMLADKVVYRSPEALGLGYENPQFVTDGDIARFITALNNRHTLAIEPQLRALKAPTLIAWATDDVFFSAKWARLADTIPGAKRRSCSRARGSSSQRSALTPSTPCSART